MMPTYAERPAATPLSLTYRNFDGDTVVIAADGQVTVDGHPDLTEFYSRF
jgi:hypothetical protein